MPRPSRRFGWRETRCTSDVAPLPSHDSLESRFLGVPAKADSSRPACKNRAMPRDARYRPSKLNSASQIFPSSLYCPVLTAAIGYWGSTKRA